MRRMKKYGMSITRKMMLTGIKSISWISWNGNIELKKEKSEIKREPWQQKSKNKSRNKKISRST